MLPILPLSENRLNGQKNDFFSSATSCLDVNNNINIPYGNTSVKLHSSCNVDHLDHQFMMSPSHHHLTTNKQTNV